jgi:hypothetical protein
MQIVITFVFKEREHDSETFNTSSKYVFSKALEKS